MTHRDHELEMDLAFVREPVDEPVAAEAWVLDLSTQEDSEIKDPDERQLTDHHPLVVRIGRSG